MPRARSYSGFLSLLPILAVFLLAGSTCQAKAVNVFVPPESPWPQFGIDMSGTRQSKYAGPTVKPELKWFFPTADTSIPGPSGRLVYASPTLGHDLTVYAPSYNGIIYAINPDGSEKWSHTVGRFLRASATVANDGSIYHLNSEGLLHLDSNGNVLTNNATYSSNDPSVTIADDGRLYVANGSTLLYLEADGSEIWSVDVGGGIEGTPVIGNGNTVYFGSQTGPGFLNAVNSEGELIWRFKIPGRNVKSATVGGDGTIYAGGQASDFFAINPDGTEKWRFTGSNQIFTAAALGADGTVVFAATNGIFALDAHGNEKCRYNDISFGHGSVLIDANGNVFATRTNRVLGISNTGSLMWEYALDQFDSVYSSVTLDSSGTLYFGASDGLYAISVAIPEPSSIMLAFLSIAALLFVFIRC